jgi:hypothetical protein
MDTITKRVRDDCVAYVRNEIYLPKRDAIELVEKCSRNIDGLANAAECSRRVLLQLEVEDDSPSAYLTKIREHGVLDQDIRDFHNMHPLAKVCVNEVKNTRATAIVISELQSGATLDDATVEGFRHVPRLGDPDQIGWLSEKMQQFFTDVDRPLPWELYWPIMAFIEMSNFQETKKFSSLNAAIRHSMEAGEFRKIVNSAPIKHSLANHPAERGSGKAGCVLWFVAPLIYVLVEYL